MISTKYRKYINDQKANLKLKRKEKRNLEVCLAKEEESLADLILAKSTLSKAIALTQVNFKGYVEKLTTMGLKTVYRDRDCKFLADFKGGNKPECLLRIQEGDKEPYLPKGEKGRGVRDVISFILRPVMWSLNIPRTRNTLVLDEPFSRLGVLSGLAGEVVKMVNRELKLQIIMITHDKQLIEIADRAWEVVHNGEYSEVRLIGE